MTRRIALLAFAACLLAAPVVAQQGPPAEPLHALDVPYVPTRQDVVEQMLRIAGVKAGDIVYDLGCGDGRIVITAAQKFGARGVGYDIDPQRIAEANANAQRAGVDKQVTFKLGDLFDADIRGATVVTLYLLPDVNLRLKPKLQHDLKPGTRIVSHDFSMGEDWKPEKTVKVGYDTVYFWTIK
jgi:SAM-dependent methyltransferase